MRAARTAAAGPGGPRPPAAQTPNSLTRPTRTSTPTPPRLTLSSVLPTAKSGMAQGAPKPPGRGIQHMRRPVSTTTPPCTPGAGEEVL